jgi:hypothetical protein
VTDFWKLRERGNNRHCAPLALKRNQIFIRSLLECPQPCPTTVLPWFTHIWWRPVFHWTFFALRHEKLGPSGIGSRKKLCRSSNFQLESFSAVKQTYQFQKSFTSSNLERLFTCLYFWYCLFGILVWLWSTTE